LIVKSLGFVLQATIVADTYDKFIFVYICSIRMHLQRFFMFLGWVAVVPVALTLASVGNAQAAAPFRFSPAGAQLDGDPILDIAIGDNIPLNFDVFIDINYIQDNIASGTHLTEVRFDGPTKMSWDPSEWIPTGFSSVVNWSQTCANWPAGSPCPLIYAKDSGYIGEYIPTVTQNPNPADFFIGTIQGVTVRPELWPGNGVRDFSLDLSSLSFDGRSQPVSYYQEVEVQQVPGPLPLLGVGAAFGCSRKLRKRIKRSTTPEIMSAIG
jgi:hypothetical protein